MTRVQSVVSRSLGAGAWITMFVALGGVISQLRCANVTCRVNSECGPRAACVENQCVSTCREDRDCTRAGEVCDPNGRCVRAGPDAGTDAPTDTAGMDTPRADTPPSDAPGTDTPLPIDMVVPPDNVPPIDTPPPPDVPVAGTGAYLDGCRADSDCASRMCAMRSARFCTRMCSTAADCANGQRCAAGRCELDDIGRTGCDLGTGAPCLEFCYGTPTAAHCTHACASGSDCAAGYACSNVGGRRICVDIERPCTAAADCPSGLGFCGAGMVGCTALCATASDCPHRLVGLPAYTCEVRSGQTVCIPPADVMGSAAIGATCAATGINLCRSGACDDGTMPPSCNQRCTVQGGCAVGYGCYPLADAGNVLLVCTATGSAWLGETCGRARDCVTGLCSTDRYCTRLCSDGLCPTGMTCMATGVTSTDGTPIRLCRRP